MVNLREVRIIGSLELLHNLASLQVKIKELGCVVGVGEDQPVLRIIQDHIHRMNTVPKLVFDVINRERVLDAVPVLVVVFVVGLVDLDDAT